MAPRLALRLSSLLACAAASPAIVGDWRAPRGSNATGDADPAVVGTTGLAPHPAYAGGLSMAGDVYIVNSPQDAGGGGVTGTRGSHLYFFLLGADPRCGAGVARLRIAGSCSVAVQAGGSCGEDGEAAAIHDDFPRVPYTTVNGSAVGGVNFGSSSWAGALGSFLGRSVVVRDAAGVRVACAPLRPLEETAAFRRLGETMRSEDFYAKHEYAVSEWVRYPEYKGALRVTGSVAMMPVVVNGVAGQLLFAEMRGADPACAYGNHTVENGCGVHVHDGKTCSDHGVILEHLYDRSKKANLTDPWIPVRYVTGGGLTKDGPDGQTAVVTARTAMTGLTMTDLEGKSLIVHDASGERIACALIPGPRCTECGGGN